METLLTHFLYLEEVTHLFNMGVKLPPTLLLCNVVRSFKLTYGVLPDLEPLVLHHYNPCEPECQNDVPMRDAIEIVSHGIITYGTIFPCSIIYQFYVFQFTEGRYPRVDELHDNNGLDMTPIMHQNIDEFWSKQESGVSVEKFPSTIAESTLSDPCAICQEEIKKGDTIRTLTCGHVFHNESNSCSGINEWIRRINSCPLCKADL